MRRPAARFFRGTARLVCYTWIMSLFSLITWPVKLVFSLAHAAIRLLMAMLWLLLNPVMLVLVAIGVAIVLYG